MTVDTLLSHWTERTLYKQLYNSHTYLWAQPNFAHVLFNSFLSSVPLCECIQAVSATIPAVLCSPRAFWLLVWCWSLTRSGRRALWGVQPIGLERENFDWMSRSTPLNASARRENFIDFYAVSSLFCYQCNGFLCPCVLGVCRYACKSEHSSLLMFFVKAKCDEKCVIWACGFSWQFETLMSVYWLEWIS